MDKLTQPSGDRRDKREQVEDKALPVDHVDVLQYRAFLFLRILGLYVIEGHLVVVPDLEDQIKYIDRYYNQWTKDNNSFQVFSNNKTFIELQEQRFDLWILTPLASNRIEYDHVKYYTPGKTIPCCSFELELLPGKTPDDRISLKVNLTAGDSSTMFFRVRYTLPDVGGFQRSSTPPAAMVSGHSSASSVQDVQAGIPADVMDYHYYTICVQADVMNSATDRYYASNVQDIQGDFKDYTSELSSASSVQDIQVPYYSNGQETKYELPYYLELFSIDREFVYGMQ